MTDWHYDDLRQIGLDFEDAAAVAAYDRSQRTNAAEDRTLLDQLGIGRRARTSATCSSSAAGSSAMHMRGCRLISS